MKTFAKGTLRVAVEELRIEGDVPRLFTSGDDPITNEDWVDFVEAIIERVETNIEHGND